MSETELVAAQGKIADIVQALLAKRAGAALKSRDQKDRKSVV